MKVRFAPGALADLAFIAAYLRPLNPAASIGVRKDIAAMARTIGQHPYSGRQQDVAGVRRRVTSRYAYLIFYAVNEDAEAVTILAIRHPAQNREYSNA